MFHNKPRLFSILLTLISASLFIILITTYSPNQTIYNIPLLFPFFFLLFINIYSLITTVSTKKTQGFLAGTFITSYLLLRLFNLNTLFYTILLIAFFATMELIMLNIAKKEQPGEYKQSTN